MGARIMDKIAVNWSKGAIFMVVKEWKAKVFAQNEVDKSRAAFGMEMESTLKVRALRMMAGILQ